MKAEKVVSEALGLSPSLRPFVAEKLIESLDANDGSPLSAKWQVELRKRCAEMDRGEVQMRDADKVFADAFSSLA